MVLWFYPQTAKDAPWIETIKQPQNDTYKVDPDKVIAMFKNKSIELGATIPHDHAMTLTQYILCYLVYARESNP